MVWSKIIFCSSSKWHKLTRDRGPQGGHLQPACQILYRWSVKNFGLYLVGQLVDRHFLFLSQKNIEYFRLLEFFYSRNLTLSLSLVWCQTDGQKGRRVTNQRAVWTFIIDRYSLTGSVCQSRYTWHWLTLSLVHDSRVSQTKSRSVFLSLVLCKIALAIDVFEHQNKLD